jgi:uncharacterized glyoxalase superfamily protein PhnB
MITQTNRFAIAVLLLTMFLLPAIAVSESNEQDLGIIRLRYAAVVVRDYDEALQWYTNVLGFEKTEEGSFGATVNGKVVTSDKAAAMDKRWIVVAPRGQKDFGIILELARPYSSTDSIHNYEARVGTETRWVFEVQDCHKFYDLASKRGVKFVETPVDEPWGVTEAMFEDLYGNIFVVKSIQSSRSEGPRRNMK